MAVKEIEIWDSNHIDSLIVETSNRKTTTLTVFADNKELTIYLDARGVRQLRLALQQIEKAAALAAGGA